MIFATLLLLAGLHTSVTTSSEDGSVVCTAGPVIYLRQPKYDLLAGSYMIYPLHCRDRDFVAGQRFIFPHRVHYPTENLDVILVWLSPAQVAGTREITWPLVYKTGGVEVCVPPAGCGFASPDSFTAWRVERLSAPVYRGMSGSTVYLSDKVTPVGMFFGGDPYAEMFSDYALFYPTVEVLNKFGLDIVDYSK